MDLSGQRMKEGIGKDEANSTSTARQRIVVRELSVSTGVSGSRSAGRIRQSTSLRPPCAMWTESIEIEPPSTPSTGNVTASSAWRAPIT
jgi:hypothetical protein